MGYQNLEVGIADQVATVWLNRPEKLNAFSADMWEDMPRVVGDLNDDDSVRAIVVAGRGPAFTVGIDIELLAEVGGARSTSSADRAVNTRSLIKRFQSTNNVLASSPKPTLAAVHGYCLGQGVNLITACDVRLATADAVFSVRETRMGLVADVGVLQRLPSIVGLGLATEWALTGEDVSGEAAHDAGLVTHLYSSREDLMAGVMDLARLIASNSPLVLAGIKEVLAANRGRTLEQALDFVANWNAAHLFSNDLTEAMAAFVEKRNPDFRGD